MFHDLTELCHQELAKSALPSLSVAVGRHGEVVHAETFESADHHAASATTAATPYLLASVTKPIVATAVALLYQQGRLDLDAPLEDYLDGVRLPVPDGVASAAPTVRHALHHTAGLGTHYDFYYGDEPQARPEPAETLPRYATIFRQPGSTFEYSNLGYALLDEVIGSVTGKDPARFVKDEVLTPIGATSGWLGPSYHGTTAPAPRWAKTGERYPDYDSTHRGASLAWLSASDLVRFGMAHAGGPTILDDTTLAVAHTPSGVTRPDQAPGDGYAFGWNVRQRMLTHAGAMGGVSTVVSVVPAQGLAVAVLCNRTNAGETVNAIRDHILESLLPDYEPAADAEPVERAGAPVTPGTWSGHISTYAGEIPVALRVSEEGDVAADLGTTTGIPVEVEPHSPGQPYDVHLTLPVRLPTPDARHHCPTVVLTLDQTEGRLHGAARAQKTDEAGGRVGNCRSHWCALTRT